MPADRVPRLEKRAIVFRGRIFHVETHRVRLSNGHRTTLEIVRHPGSVVLIVQPTRETLVLIRQYRYVIGKWIWELPAGSIDRGERPAAAARRECEEEVGLRPHRVRRLATFYPTPGFCDERMDFFRCDRLTVPRRRASLDEDEQIEPRTFTLKNVRRLIRQGAIIDMKTIVGLRLVDARGRA